MSRKQGSEERIAVVTGASSGIGACIADRLGLEGYSTFLVGRDREALDRAASDAEDRPGSRTWTISADLRQDEGLEKVTRRVREEADGVDVLVHSAGVYSRGELAEATAEEYESLFDTNVRARFLLTRELLPFLIRRGGQVVFVGSSLAHRAPGEVGLYAATMHADRAVAEALRDEVNEDGVRVLSVHLGRTDTRMQREVLAAEGRDYEPEYLMKPETVAEAVCGCLRLPRDAEVTEIRMRPMRKLPDS